MRVAEDLSRAVESAQQARFARPCAFRRQPLAVRHGARADGSVSYVDGANVAGFVKVADAMLAQGVI